MYPYIAPENFDNSRISSITNDQLIIKISDLLKQKEISKYITSKEKLLSLIKSHCEFFKISDDNENLEYNVPDNMTVFNILNIPLNMTKKDVIDNIELINLQFNRLYKRGFYWVLSTTEKETVICMQNSLRDLYFEESKVKYDLVNKNQILKNMKEIVEKNLYQKDTKNLGIGGNNFKKKNTFQRGKMSDTDNDAFSWRKGSSDIKSSFDVNDKQGYKKNNYYNNNYNRGGYQKKRNRYNSDVGGQSYHNNYYENNNNYYNNNNHYKNSMNNNNNNKDLEIDISNLKYPIMIKNKYSFEDIKSFYNKICNNKLYPQSPEFLSTICNDIISNSQKTLVSLDELIESSKKLNNENDNEKINVNMKIPKVNPLSNLGKNTKNENFPSTVEENTKEE